MRRTVQKALDAALCFLHSPAMRTHRQIIDDAGGYQALSAKIGEPASRVRFWHRRSSIPAEAWKACADRAVCSLDELAEAAATRPQTEAA
jgi:hypothetical protein